MQTTAVELKQNYIVILWGICLIYLRYNFVIRGLGLKDRQ
jgi:hypothetical protein